MKTIAIIVYIILGIWAIFSFDTEKLSLFFRYYVANILAEPIKTCLYTLAIPISIVCLYKGIYKQIMNQTESIEPALSNFKDFNIKIDPINTTRDYIKIYNRLNTNEARKDIKDQILKFIDDSRFFYKNYPSAFKNNIAFNQMYDMSSSTQVTVLRIDKFKETILFISHNSNLPDKKISMYTYDKLPDNESLYKILDSAFTDKSLNILNDYYYSFEKNGVGQYGSAGVGVAAESVNKPKWMLLWLPDPFNAENNLNKLILESIWLTKT